MTAVLMLLVLCAVGSLSILLAGRTRCTPAAAPAARNTYSVNINYKYILPPRTCQ